MGNKFRAACTASRPERLIRGVIAVFIAAFAISSIESSLYVAVLGGLTALGVLAMAVTGWCPGNMLGRGNIHNQAGVDGYPDARHLTGLE